MRTCMHAYVCIHLSVAYLLKGSRDDDATVAEDVASGNSCLIDVNVFLLSQEFFIGKNMSVRNLLNEAAVYLAN